MTLLDCTAWNSCHKDPQNTYLHKLYDPESHVGPDNVQLAALGWVPLWQ